MPTIDSQVHAYEANTPKRPWDTVPNWPAHVTGDEMVAAMDKVGVDGAIFISAFSMYRYDASYAVEVQRAHHGVKPVDPDDPMRRTSSPTEENAGHGRNPHHADEEAQARSEQPGDRPDRPRGRPLPFPVNMLCWGNLEAGASIIDRHPDTLFILDHMGILQPRTPPAPPEPWADLPKVLELAKRPNVMMVDFGSNSNAQASAIASPAPVPAGPR